MTLEFRNSAILCRWYGCCPTGSTQNLRQCSECTCEEAKRPCLRLRHRGLSPSARQWLPRWSRTRRCICNLRPRMWQRPRGAAAKAATLATAQQRGKTPPKRKTRSVHLPRPFLGSAPAPPGVNPDNPIFGNVPLVFCILRILMILRNTWYKFRLLRISVLTEFCFYLDYLHFLDYLE
jgi:hypothetical protein